jgi:hypothetical protein
MFGTSLAYAVASSNRSNQPALSPIEGFNRFAPTSLRGAQDKRSVQNV